MLRVKRLAIGIIGIVVIVADAEAATFRSRRVETFETAIVYVPSLHRVGVECRRSSSGTCRFEINTFGRVLTIDLRRGGSRTLMRIDPAATYRVGTAPLTGPWLPLPVVG